MRKPRRTDDFPVAFVHRNVAPFEACLRRSLAPGVSELETDRRGRALVHEVHDALPPVNVLARVHAGAAEADASLRRHAGHLGIDESRTAHGPGPEVNQVEVL